MEREGAPLNALIPCSNHRSIPLFAHILHIQFLAACLAVPSKEFQRIRRTISWARVNYRAAASNTDDRPAAQAENAWILPFLLCAAIRIGGMQLRYSDLIKQSRMPKPNISIVSCTRWPNSAQYMCIVRSNRGICNDELIKMFVSRVFLSFNGVRCDGIGAAAALRGQMKLHSRENHLKWM